MDDQLNESPLVSTREALTPAQMVLLAAFGALLWFAAAMLMRLIGPMGALQGMGRVILYVLVIPATFPFVLIARKLATLRPDQTAHGVTVATAVATLLDGIALAWFPTLYGTDIGQVAAAGAAILWGAGVGLALGLLMNKPRQP